MGKRTITLWILISAVILPLVLLGGVFGLFLFRPVAPPGERLVTVAPGQPFNQVATRLEKEGVVDSALGLKLLARLQGAARQVQAGNYEFSSPASPREVLARLVSGDVRRLRFTVPEGLTLAEIAAKLEAEGFGRARAFLELSGDQGFIRGLDLPGPTLEGYLFPETYTVTAGMPERELVEAMVRELRRRLSPELVAQATGRGLNVHQLLTLASIIQKEAGNLAEMPLISAVFHNRLKRGIALQADPTVIYGVKDFDGNLTRKHLNTPTPYNTYLRRGLPPGPIANPGEDALRAAAEPAPAEYLYFVARGDGTHAFSSTLR